MKATATSFQKGQSGNPSGRPSGFRNRATLALEQILDGEGEEITRRAIELAKDGDPQALRTCLDRLMPVRKDRPVIFELPTVEKPEDLPKATNALLQAVAAGDLTPSEASDLGKALDVHMKAIETAEIVARLERLETGEQ
ncbi:DUF5681 domain-containing protein [Methylobacterium durans]|uniref:DUF5681 domain-containing protein n=1 Tax=Methylobacterium durans TaxID=2202825 RepID=UPI002B00137C|nr:DUF5681 domain-containing protein [Methylobacterium durans]MEA1832569.1 DUF5681 domain-containing protein [Methylobacterium durans]